MSEYQSNSEHCQNYISYLLTQITVRLTLFLPLSLFPPLSFSLCTSAPSLVISYDTVLCCTVRYPVCDLIWSYPNSMKVKNKRMSEISVDNFCLLRVRVIEIEHLVPYLIPYLTYLLHVLFPFSLRHFSSHFSYFSSLSRLRCCVRRWREEIQNQVKDGRSMISSSLPRYPLSAFSIYLSISTLVNVCVCWVWWTACLKHNFRSSEHLQLHMMPTHLNSESWPDTTQTPHFTLLSPPITSSLSCPHLHLAYLISPYKYFRNLFSSILSVLTTSLLDSAILIALSTLFSSLPQVIWDGKAYWSPGCSQGSYEGQSAGQSRWGQVPS